MRTHFNTVVLSLAVLAILNITLTASGEEREAPVPRLRTEVEAVLVKAPKPVTGEQLPVLHVPVCGWADAEPRYVVFQFQGMESDAPTEPDLPGLVAELEERFGAQPAGTGRHVGFTPGLIFSLNLPVETLRSRVEQGLDLAEETGMPVFFHLDDMHFWWKRTELHTDPSCVEWSDFPAEGQAEGPVIERYWLNWGSFQVFPAPPPNYESGRFRDDVRRALTEGFGRPIAKRLARWRASGKAHLFAGIAVGNETEVPYDLRPLLSTPKGQEPVGRDTTRRPPREVKMRRDEMVRAGYHALYDRGFTREKVRRLAQGRGVSVSHVVSELRHAVAHDYAEFRARVLAEAGLPRARIYTHFVSPMRPFIEKYRGSPVVDRFPRVRDSVNAHSRPGYTLVREFTDLPDLLAKIRDSRRESGGELGSAWAGVETYCTIGQPGRPQTLQEYEAYLGGLFAHDMRLINVYGWNVPREGPSAPFSVKNAPGVVQAVANWVSGNALPSDWRGAPPGEGGPPQGAMRLEPKMQRLQQLLAKRREAGDDISHIAEMMRPMEGLMREGKVEAAEQLVDRALRAAEQGGDAPQAPSPTPEQSSASLAQKAQGLQERIRRWVASGGDPNRIRPHADRLRPLLQTGNHAEAEKVIDQILAVVSTAPSHEAASPRPPGRRSGAFRSTPTSVRLGKLTEAAEIIYHDHRFIFTMDRNGENVVQMTFENPRHWEHVAVSYDHRYVLGNMHSTPGQSELWLFDLEGGTEARLVPDFPSAGGGGVAWDPEGRIYFAGSERSRQNDLYRINTDGTGLEQLTDTPQYYEADVGASEDGSLMTYAAAYPAEGTCGIWVANTDGTEVREIYKGGKVGTHSAHDPEFSPDGKRVVFSVVNSEHHNFVDTHNTAHDLWVCNLDGSDPIRITEPGAIRIIPNWQGEWIVFTEMSDQGEEFIGSAIVHENGTGYRRLVKGGKMPKWIPPKKEG